MKPLCRSFYRSLLVKGYEFKRVKGIPYWRCSRLGFDDWVNWTETVVGPMCLFIAKWGIDV
jgi:hypothetical protein